MIPDITALQATSQRALSRLSLQPDQMTEKRANTALCRQDGRRPGDLFTCIGIVVTNLLKNLDLVTHFYNQLDTAGQLVAEWTMLRCGEM